MPRRTETHIFVPVLNKTESSSHSYCGKQAENKKTPICCLLQEIPASERQWLQTTQNRAVYSASFSLRPSLFSPIRRCPQLIKIPLPIYLVRSTLTLSRPYPKTLKICCLDLPFARSLLRHAGGVLHYCSGSNTLRFASAILAVFCTVNSQHWPLLAYVFLLWGCYLLVLCPQRCTLPYREPGLGGYIWPSKKWWTNYTESYSLHFLVYNVFDVNIIHTIFWSNYIQHLTPLLNQNLLLVFNPWMHRGGCLYDFFKKKK